MELEHPQSALHLLAGSLQPRHGVVTHAVEPRPWLSLYGRFIARKQPAHQPPPEADGEPVELALIQQLPEELVLLVLHMLPPYQLGKVALVCRQWRLLIEHPRLWEQACVPAFQLTHPTRPALHKLCGSYRKSWKRLFMEHPHLRFDGLYVSRNTYVRSGVAEFTRNRPCHLVVYFRYFRFFPDGTVLYRTSPATVSKVAKSMAGPRAGFVGDEGQQAPAAMMAAREHVFVGRYLIKGNQVWILIRYPNNCMTEIRVRMLLRSTVPGAHNRLDVTQLFTYDKELHLATSLQPQDQEEEGEAVAVDAEPEGAGVRRKEHRRGLSSCVFTAWDQVHTSILNQPPATLDFFCPG